MKASRLIVSKLPPSTTDCRLDPSKALALIRVTDEGISICLRLVQFLNICSVIAVMATPSQLIPSSAVQPIKR